MPMIRFIEHGGIEHQIAAEPGLTAMEVAVNHDVPGIDADCRGACACATCHVFVESEWFDRLPPRSEMEQGMLEFTDDVKPTSRLSCQIRIENGFDGLVLRLPAAQR